MKAPTTFLDFKNLIFNLEHRERLLFQTNDKLMLEIYFTIVVNDKDMFNIKRNNNLNFKMYKDYNGKTEKIVFNKSRYKKLCTNDFLETFFNAICQNCKPIQAK
jgi:hypothetical protein